MMFIKMGFRNVFRNKRRSFLTAVIIGLGLAAMIIVDGYLQGMNENMVRTVTTSLISEGQVHHPDFRDSFKVEYQIKNPVKVREILNNDKNVQAYTERVISFGMISSPRAMKSVTFFGVQPEKENLVSNTWKQTVEGSFVTDENSLVIGEILQKRLMVDPGDKVVVTVAKSETGDISQELFRITGVIKAGSKEMDEKSAFIHISKAKKILGLENNIHEIAIKFSDRKKGEDLNSPLWTKLNSTGNKAESWKQIVSGLVSMMDMADQSKAIVAFVLMVLVALGIVNTLFMALYERMFEFTVLRALGTKSCEIVFMIVSEAGSLSLLSVLSGIVIAFLIALPLSYFGINYNGIEFGEVTFREPVYFSFAWHQFTLLPIAAFIFTVLVGLYPAIHAGRIKISDAMKRSL